MTWPQVLEQLLAWLQDPPQCAGGGKLGVIPIHVAVEYVKERIERGDIMPPEAIYPANDGIDLYWADNVRHWRVHHNGTVTTWELRWTI